MIRVGSCVVFFLFCCGDDFDNAADLAVENLADAQEHVGGDIVAVIEPDHRGG